jgi:uncharacterized metal-binding protein
MALNSFHTDFLAMSAETLVSGFLAGQSVDVTSRRPAANHDLTWLWIPFIQWWANNANEHK